MKTPKKLKKRIKKNITLFLFLTGTLSILTGLILTGYINISIVLIDETPPTIEKINIVDFDKETKEISIEVLVKDNSKEVTCILLKEEKEEKQISKNNKCTYKLTNKDYEIYLIDKQNNKSTNQNLFKDINEVLDISLEEIKYISLKDSKKLNYQITALGEINETPTFTSSNTKILEITKDGAIKPKKEGTTTITIELNNKKDTKEITVTKLINKQEITTKTFLPCNKYTKEEAKLYDEILEYKINKSGLKTRGGVVAAARFLTLEFPYKLSYFPENGRVNGKTYVADGEGRYYHKGLYLSEDKFSEITTTVTGPVIWGCPLQIALGEPDQPRGSYFQNGLDCSGFVAWALYNGGYDPGDLGAGFSNTTDFSKLGERHQITRDFLKNGNIKAGDLIGNDGHIGIIIGVSDNLIIIGDTSNKDRGLTARKFTHNQLINLGYYTYIELMDDYYKEEGNYTNMF